MAIKYRIHPAIGVARVGDSPDDFFIGPEAPGVPPTLNKPDGSSAQPGKYKDQQHKIKRQGARFRIYEYTEDDAGVVTKVREISGAEAQIEWEVHLANRKPAEKTRFFAVPANSRTPRNKEVKDRSKLIIDPGPQRISGVNQPMKTLHGTFMDTVNVKLGDLLTDGGGRLIVLGGHGKSQSDDGRRLSESDDDFADNDGWCDDTSDGAVRATVTLNGSNEKIAADPAWVIVAPPDFAPPLQNVVTLYDVVYDVAAKFDSSLAVTDATRVSFTTDVYPILRRVCSMHWVSDFAAQGHAGGSSGDFTSHVNELARNDPNDSRRNRDLSEIAGSETPRHRRHAEAGDLQQNPGDFPDRCAIRADAAMGRRKVFGGLARRRTRADAARQVAGDGSATRARSRGPGIMRRRTFLSRDRSRPDHARRKSRCKDLREKATVPHQYQSASRHADRKDGRALASRLLCL